MNAEVSSTAKPVASALPDPTPVSEPPSDQKPRANKPSFRDK